MARRVKQGMSYVEVLGAILIISLISTVVLGAVQLSSQVRLMGQRTKSATRGAEVMMTAVQVALSQTDWEALQEVEDLGALIGDYGVRVMVDEALSYRLDLWPVTVKAGTTWYFDQAAPPDLTLGMGMAFAPEGRSLQVILPKEATYAFDTSQMSGQFVSNTPWPSDVIGELVAELTRQGSYYHMALVKGSVSGVAKLVVDQTLADETITLTITSQGASTPGVQRVTCVIDGTKLEETPDDLSLRVINQSRAKVLVKVVGDTDELREIPLIIQADQGAVDVVYQPTHSGSNYYVAVLTVADEMGRVGKQLITLVGIQKEAEEDED